MIYSGYKHDITGIQQILAQSYHVCLYRIEVLNLINSRIIKLALIIFSLVSHTEVKTQTVRTVHISINVISLITIQLL